MATETLATFESATAVAYEWVNAIGDGLDCDKHFALQALRGVLHALRNRLTLDQNAHLSAQLPIMIRGLYYENWDPQPFPDRDRSREGFLEHVRSSLTGYDGDGVAEIVEVVFAVLRRHISWGEDEKIAKALPHAIAAFWTPPPAY